MPDTFTTEQNRAASLRGKNILVAAAAGSGKTAVLTERIFRMITDKARPVDINRLLVVTFTEAAAAEMRARISAAIMAGLDADPGNARLAEQAGLLYLAPISTIHSFCLRILKKYFDRVEGLDPYFRIGDQTEMEILKSQAIDELFEEEYAAGNDGFYGLAERYGGGKTKDDRLGDLIVGVYEFLINSPFPWESLAEYLSYFNGSAVSPWENIVKDEMRREFRGVLACADRAVGLCRSPGGPEKYALALEADKRLVYSLMEKLDGQDARMDGQNARMDGQDARPDGSGRAPDPCQERPAADGLNAVYGAISNLSHERIFPYKKEADISERLKEAVKEMREKEIKKKLRSIKETFFFKSPEAMSRDIVKAAPVMEALGALTRKFALRFAELKREKNILDFSDLEHFCVKILIDKDPATGEIRPTEAAREIAGGFDEILIDEYQDSNSVQELILGAIAKPGGRFMVGDVKQSIYRFRRANPRIFIDKYENYTPDAPEAPDWPEKPRLSAANIIDFPLSRRGVPGGGADDKTEMSGEMGVRIDLSKNFRSRAEVIHAVNRVFGRLMTKDLGEIAYDWRAALYPGAEFPPAEGMNAEVMLIDAAQGRGGETEDIFFGDTLSDTPSDPFSDSPDEAESPEAEMSGAELEAGMIARRIKSMVDGGFRVTDQADRRLRPVRFGDIAVITRSISDVADIYARRFKSLDIPMHADARLGLFESAEVMNALSLLRVVDNPRQDMHLAAALLSPVYGFTPDELVTVRLTDREACLYECVLNVACGGATEIGNKLAAFLDDLERWRDMAEYMPVSRLIGRIFEDTGWTGLAGASAGAAGQAALAALAEKAAVFEETTYKGLFHFILYIDRLRKSGADVVPEEAASTGAVRLMTAHKSKGLEFPVVFVSMLGKQFNRADERERVLMHGELGFGPAWIDLERRTKSDTIARLALSRRIRLESLAEEMRVLYVAMTRAKEKLILTGCARKLGEKLAKWELYAKDDILPDYYRAGCRTFLDWVMPCALDDPEIEVSVRDAEAMAYGSAREAAEIYRRFGALAGAAGNPADSEDLARLIWRVYPNETDVKLPSKVSISEVKRILDSMLLGDAAGLEPYRTDIRRAARFAGPGGREDALTRGTAIHTVMEHLELDTERSAAAISELIGRLVERNIMTASDAELVPTGHVLDFLNSPLAERMRAAGDVYRETPFVMGLRADELYPGIASEELILVHGIIDCWFEENGEIVLVDYKSDSDPENAAPRYRGQMEVYARALAKSTGRKVREKLLYLFRFGTCERVL
ncbi:MAG: UvrD-helicase domain-containing protein [Firmicutes bacterium]|nr:UvrD-helicase domain-containing protein [Bacillota bacterium]